MPTTKNFSAQAHDVGQGFVSGQKILSRYTLDRMLGQGGMGVVWLAQDEELDRQVALKFLPALVVNDRASLTELKRETRRSLELTHPNIVRTYDFLQDGPLAGISMEYVDSDTLRNRKSDQPSGVFEPDQLGDWTIQLSHALDYAHHMATIVHRDLKPANLLVNGRNHLKVADFGISRSLVESLTQVSGAATVSGTLVYMSPQQLQGSRAHALDDIYAMGATLYELCTSRPPFFSGDISQQVQHKIPPSMSERRAEFGIAQGNLPENWETTVAACLAKDPAARPQSAGEIAARLGLRESASTTTHAAPVLPISRVAGSGWGVPPTSQEHHGPAAVPMFRRSKWTPVAAAASVVLLVAGGLFLLLGSHKNNPAPPPADVAVDAPADPKPADPKPADVAGQSSGAGSAGSKAVADVPAPVVDPAKAANARGGIFVETEPAGARVKVDDRPAEKTPAPLKDLTVGTHTIRVMMDGYVDYSMPVEVKEGQITSMEKIKLVRSIGWINVTTTPPGAELVVKGPDGVVSKPSTVSPWNSEKLPTGDYEITATRQGPGWAPVTRKVSIAGDQSLPVALDLSGGRVEITSVPPDATVLLNDKPVGKTPFTAQDVPPGSPQYKVAFVGYDTVPVPAKIEPGQPFKFEAKLTKIAAKAPVRQTSTRTASKSSHHGDDDDDHPGQTGRILRGIFGGGGGTVIVPGPGRFPHP